MTYLSILILIFTSFTVMAQDSDECKAQYLDISKTQRESGNYTYFKKYSYYTQSGRQDASIDTLYFMTLNHVLDIRLTWKQYYLLQIKMNATPGENSYTAPSLEVLIPQMWGLLKSLGKVSEINLEAEQEAKHMFKHIKSMLLPEVIGNNRTFYKNLNSDNQKVIREEGDGKYIVRVNGCSQSWKMDMSEYLQYSNPQEETQKIEKDLVINSSREVLQSIEAQLNPSSYFAGKLTKFLTKY